MFISFVALLASASVTEPAVVIPDVLVAWGYIWNNPGLITLGQNFATSTTNLFVYTLLTVGVGMLIASLTPRVYSRIMVVLAAIIFIATFIFIGSLALASTSSFAAGLSSMTGGNVTVDGVITQAQQGGFSFVPVNSVATWLAVPFGVLLFNGFNYSTYVSGEVYLMNSGGGLTSVETARELPVRIVESGPAGGVIAAQFYGRLAGDADLLAFDMGGTTAKACLIHDGEVSVRSDYEVARMVRFKRGSGLSLRVPVVDILEVGAGGGSIAHPSGLGLLQVGPESAGAVPGPACYGQGGELPTVTDADLLLGYLDPGYFLGGEMALDVEAARAAMAHGLAAPLGVSVETATWGVHDIVNEYMASAIKTYLLERGQDPTTVSLVAFGGAGPVHAYGVAQKLGMRRVLVPPAAGAMSALGFLLAPPAIELARTYKAPFREFDGALADRHCDAMRAEARRLLPALGRAEPTYTLAADMRYVGQGYEIRVPLPGARFAGLEPAAMQAAFEAGYLATYGRTYPDTEAEVINLRVLAALPALPFTPRRLSADGAAQAARKGRRPATFGAGTVVECPVYERYRLPAGATIEGPAIIEERESTTVCGPGSRLRVDAYGILAVELGVAAGIGAAPRGGRA